MLHHRALGRDLETLVVAVIDNRRAMLAMMRAMLAAIGTGRIETYETPTGALEAMGRHAPDLVIAASEMQPHSGPALVRSMRHLSAAPLCFVPAMIMSVHAKPSLVAEAVRAGAHQVLVLPTSASTLYRRLDWLLNDDRAFELQGEHYVVSGMEERLSISFQRPVYMPDPAATPIADDRGDEVPAEAETFAEKARAVRG
jgi:DNA-binding NarL/FixJ family response regulator